VGFRVYLFDLDGTLIDSVELILKSFHHTREQHFGDRLSDDYYLEILGLTLRDTFKRMADSPQAVEAMVKTYVAHNLDHHDAMVRAYPGIVEVVRELVRRGARLGLVTSKLHDNARRGLRVVGIEDAFEVVIGAEDVTRGKPDPEPVLLALKRMGATAEETIFVGDSPHDIESGRSARVKTAAATWGPFSRAALEAAEPDFWLEKPADLLAQGACATDE
jgi:pyrophosphatase PpaX